MSKSLLVASMKADYVPFGKREKEKIVIGIGKPTKQKTGEYGCPVYIPGHDGKIVIRGEDSLQALCLSLRFLKTRIYDMIGKGNKFYYANTDLEIAFETCFDK